VVAWGEKEPGERETLDDGSILQTPGIVPQSVASREFADGTVLYIESMSYDVARLCVVRPGTTWGVYDDMFDYANVFKALVALNTWNYPEQREPDGWHRNPTTHRRRPNGDARKEYLHP
jgi:hypothetical protein